MSHHEPKTTQLYRSHKTAGASFVDFAGWNMPLHYGSQKAEHLATRQHAGIFDVSHMLAVDISGTQARTFARRVLSNDIDRVTKPGGAIYGCLLNEQGGVIDDTIWWVFNESKLLVVLNAATRESDLAWLTKQAADLQVTITPRYEHGIIAVQGPNAREIVTSVLPQYASDGLTPMQATSCDTVVVSRTGYTGEDGLELILPADQLTNTWNKLTEAGVTPCGLGARDGLRLEAGMMLYGHELTESISPLEAGIGWCVNFSDPERNFIGRAALEQQQQQNHHRHLIGLVLDKGMLRAGYRVHQLSGEPVGEITSGGFSPCVKASIALAFLDAGVTSTDTLAVDIRGKLHQVKTVSPPFVRKGKVLI